MALKAAIILNLIYSWCLHQKKEGHPNGWPSFVRVKLN